MILSGGNFGGLEVQNNEETIGVVDENGVWVYKKIDENQFSFFGMASSLNINIEELTIVTL